MKSNNTLLHYLFFVCFLSIIGTSCNPSKYLREDEVLITDAKINIKDKRQVTNKRELKYQLETIAEPQPNSGIFKFRLWLYLRMREKGKDSGLGNWLKDKLGEAPALYDPQKVEKNRMEMKEFLKDNGYFENDISITSVTSKEQKVKINYNVDTRGQYKINEIFLPEDSSQIASIIYHAASNSLLEPGDAYQELLLANERTRISQVAQNKGYLDFNQNSIFYFVDTIPDSRKLDIYVRVDEREKNNPQTQFKVGRTYIYPYFDLSDSTLLLNPDTLLYRPDFTLIQNKEILKPSVFNNLILQKQGEVYNKSYQDVSVSHLLDLGLFKFVNLRYGSSQDSLGNPMLDRYFYLTPGVDRVLTTDLELNNRTGSFYGTSLGLTYNDKNLFSRAIDWKNSISAGIETQQGVKGPLINTLELKLETSLSLPRLLFFGKNRQFTGIFVPTTSLTFRNNYQRRTNLFSINSTEVSYAYNWRPNREIEHILEPITIRSVRVLSTSQEFEELRNNVGRLRNSFRNFLIGGIRYTFIRITQTQDAKAPYWYYKGNLKLAGNTFSLFSKTGENGNPGTIFGQEFSQFVSVEQDIRYHFPFLRKGKLAFRFNPAIGIAYGNSDLLPYVEQFFVGGSNSIRAFRIRGVGPGSFISPQIGDEQVTQQFIDQTGDIKLEFNAEYRFPLFSYLRGALFADAGNVWLINPDPGIPAGNFKFDKFYKEIAIGVGFGIRLDLNFFVIRLDIASPVRAPVEGEGFQWTKNGFDPLSKNWRQDNLVWNIAIGYPF